MILHILPNGIAKLEALIHGQLFLCSHFPSICTQIIILRSPRSLNLQIDHGKFEHFLFILVGSVFVLLLLIYAQLLPFCADELGNIRKTFKHHLILLLIFLDDTFLVLTVEKEIRVRYQFVGRGHWFIYVFE